MRRPLIQRNFFFLFLSKQLPRAGGPQTHRCRPRATNKERAHSRPMAARPEQRVRQLAGYASGGEQSGARAAPVDEPASRDISWLRALQVGASRAEQEAFQAAADSIVKPFARLPAARWRLQEATNLSPLVSSAAPPAHLFVRFRRREPQALAKVRKKLDQLKWPPTRLFYSVESGAGPLDALCKLLANFSSSPARGNKPNKTRSRSLARPIRPLELHSVGRKIGRRRESWPPFVPLHR